jgi:UDP-N-acetyl-2-amino-2-deoxyglucuronate dehydrogenase
MMWKIGIIGCGMIAEFHAEAIANVYGAQLTAVYGRNTEKAKGFASKYQCAAYDDLDDFLAMADVDIVTIATPSGAHMEPALAAAAAGKHIICEKPLEINEERISCMIDAAQNHGVLLSGIFNRRFNPAVTSLKTAIDQRRFGTLSLCDAQIKWYRDQAYYDSGAWRGTKKYDGGGVLMNQSIHTIDLLLYFMGDVRRVSGSTACVSHDLIEVEDTAVAILEFVNGAKGVIQATTSCWSAQGHPAEIHICGSEGSAFMADDRFRIWDFLHKNEEDDLIKSTLMVKNEIGLGANDPRAINTLGHQRNIEDVLDALDHNTVPMITGQEALKSVRLINAIYKSAEQNGAWITLSSL